MFGGTVEGSYQSPPAVSASARSPTRSGKYVDSVTDRQNLSVKEMTLLWKLTGKFELNYLESYGLQLKSNSRKKTKCVTLCSVNGKHC